ncbi:hypothetical protein ABFO74_00375 [Acinetobacter baumannii]
MESIDSKLADYEGYVRFILSLSAELNAICRNSISSSKRSISNFLFADKLLSKTRKLIAFFYFITRPEFTPSAIVPVENHDSLFKVKEIMVNKES